MSIRLAEEFKQYDADNPQIYESFKASALELAAAGRKRAGAKLIWEHLRWMTAVRAQEIGGKAFKLNNNFPSYFARKLMVEDPQRFGSFFHTRERWS